MSALGGGKFSYQGEEYEFIDEIKKNLEDLVCPICQEILSDPLITSCGHLFCRRCLEEDGRDLKDCPVCRQTYTSMSDQFHVRKIGGLRVKCPRASKGCRWSGELKEAKGHHAASCQCVDVLCKNGCGTRLQRSAIANHETKQCPKRYFICPHCGEEGTFDVIESSHYTVCTDFPVFCPTGCSMQVPRCELESHLNDVCCKKLVRCKYHQIGCPTVLEVKDMEEHLETQKDAHLELAMNAIVKLNTCVSQLQLLPALSQQLAGAMVPLSRPWLETPSTLPFPPWIIKLEGYAEKKAKNLTWYSEPFFTHPGGYKMCLGVFPNGVDTVKGQHLSAYIFLMRGETDDILKWPFHGTIVIHLMNQTEDDNHIEFAANYKSETLKEASVQVLAPRKRSRGLGQSRIVALSSLADPATPSVKYLVDDCLYFKIDSSRVDT